MGRGEKGEKSNRKGGRMNEGEEPALLIKNRSRAPDSKYLFLIA